MSWILYNISIWFKQRQDKRCNIIAEALKRNFNSLYDLVMETKISFIILYTDLVAMQKEGFVFKVKTTKTHLYFLTNKGKTKFRYPVN